MRRILQLTAATTAISLGVAAAPAMAQETFRNQNTRAFANGTAYPTIPAVGTITASRGATKVYVPFTCPASGYDCHGTFSVRTNSRINVRGVFRSIFLGFDFTRRFYATAGATETVALDVPRQACQQLRRRGKLGLVFRATIRRPTTDHAIARRVVVRAKRSNFRCPSKL